MLNSFSSVLFLSLSLASSSCLCHSLPSISSILFLFFCLLAAFSVIKNPYLFSFLFLITKILGIIQISFYSALVQIETASTSISSLAVFVISLSCSLPSSFCTFSTCLSFPYLVSLFSSCVPPYLPLLPPSTPSTFHHFHISLRPQFPLAHP